MLLLAVLGFTNVVDTVVVLEDVSEATNGPPMTTAAAPKTSNPARVCMTIDLPDLTLSARYLWQIPR